jgi:hypothetical protein
MSTPKYHALCKCGALLVPAEHFFKGKKWLCLSCGLIYAQPPRMQAWTVEAEARKEQLTTEFDLNCGNQLLCMGLYRADCSLCMSGQQEHIRHATQRDWQLCNVALKWLSDRTGREFGLVNGDIYHVGSTKPISPEDYRDILRGGI